MSRTTARPVDENGNVCPVAITFGDDHALGKFITITDSRYAGSDKDEQGEGIVFEFDERFGVSVNLAELNMVWITDMMKENTGALNLIIYKIETWLIKQNIIKHPERTINPLN